MIREFVIPSRSLFGAGCLEAIGRVALSLGVTRVLVVGDIGIARTGLLDRVEALLTAAGIDVVRYADVDGEPTLTDVEEASARYESEGCDGIVGVGGGSPNDTAKAVGIHVANPGPLPQWVGGNKTAHQAPPLICVNTTAGTASEVSRAFIIGQADGSKLVFKEDNALARITINDPEVMVGLPARVTGATGMDALTHAVEAYVSTGAYVLTRELSAAAVGLVFEHLPAVLAGPENLEHREGMTYAQSLAGMAFGNAGVGVVHAMAHCLGSRFHLRHGLCVGALLAHGVAFNARAVGDLYARLARRTFPADAGDLDDAAAVALLVERIAGLSELAGTGVALTELGVTEADVDDLATATLAEPNLPRNPLQPSFDEIRAVWAGALAGVRPTC